MTVTATNNRISYAGNGTNGPFPLNFAFLADSHLKVIASEIATGIDTVLTLNTHYTCLGAGVALGAGSISITLAGAWALMPATYNLTIIRDPDQLQNTDLTANDKFPAETVETAFDKLTMLCQRFTDVFKRSMKAPDSYSTDLVFSSTDWALRASKGVVFDAGGNLTVGALASVAVSAAMVALVQAASISAAQAILLIPQSKNFVGNASLRVDQLSLASGFTPTTSAVLTDRWGSGLTQASKLTFQRVLDGPPGFLYSLKVTVAAQFAPGAADAFNMSTCIEGYDIVPLKVGTADAAQVTFSFWAKTSVPGNYSFRMYNGNGGAPRQYLFTQAITGIWTKYTKTVTMDTAGTWDATNGIGLLLGVDLGSGTNAQSVNVNAWGAENRTGVTGNVSFVNQVNGSTLNLAGFKFEGGAVATAHDVPVYSAEWLHCMRYLRRFKGVQAGNRIAGIGAVFAATDAFFVYNDVPMRALPTCSFNGSIALNDNTVSAAVTAIGTLIWDQSGIEIPITAGGGGLTVGRACTIRSNSATDYLQLDASI